MSRRYGSGSDIVDHILREQERRDNLAEFVAMTRHPTAEEQAKQEQARLKMERDGRIETMWLAGTVTLIVVLSVVALVWMYSL